MQRIDYAGCSERGRTRKENQDRWFGDHELGLYLVTDGMGGHCAGALAARVVAHALPMLIKQNLAAFAVLSTPAAQRTLAEIILELNRLLRAESRGHPGLDGMGATLVLALIRGQEALLTHHGDSRAYLYRSGKLRQLTQDHTLGQLMIETGEIPVEQSGQHPACHQLTQYIGMPELPEPELIWQPLLAHDRVLLCSDGVSKTVDFKLLRTVVGSELPPPKTCQELLRAARVSGSDDDMTALILDLLH